MNSLSVKAKFQIAQFKSSKQIFCKFAGQFDLKGQGQQFLEWSKPLDDQYTAQVFKYLVGNRLNFSLVRVNQET